MYPVPFSVKVSAILPLDARSLSLRTAPLNSLRSVTTKESLTETFFP